MTPLALDVYKIMAGEGNHLSRDGRKKNRESLGGFGENVKGTIKRGHLREEWDLYLVLFLFERERESKGWGEEQR